MVRLGFITKWIVALTLAGVFASDAAGAPAFARRYETSCATCHQAFPRLNAVGESFRLSGFQFVDDELYRKREPVDLGDDAYRRLWPRALWPGEAPRYSPLSFVMRMMSEVDLDGTRPETVTMLLPEEVELVWAGNLGDDIAFYGDVIFLQKDFGGGDPDSWATVKGWVQFQDVIGENWFNVRVGTVGTQTLALFTARDANFYGTHQYLYSSWALPLPDLDAAGLTEFKGNNFSLVPQGGIEINGFGSRWFYAVGLVNGDPETHPTQAPASDVSYWGMSQGSGSSDVYLHLAKKFGGLSFTRAEEKSTTELTTGAEFWRDDSVMLSLFAYRGVADIRAATTTGTTDVSEDEFWRLAAGIQASLGDLTAAVAWMKGENDHPYGTLSDQSVDSTNWHIELIYFAYPWALPYVRYEVLDLELIDVPGIQKNQDIERVLAGAKLMLRPNVSLTTEAAYYTEGEELEEGFDETLFLLFAVSF